MIEVGHLNKTYDRGRRNANQVLHDISFTLPDTGFVCILGASGCGKTSLLNAIGGLDSFESGTLTTGEVAVNRYGTRAYEAERNRNFGYIFQNYYLLMDHSVAYNVYLGLHSLALTHTEKLKRVRQALRAVEMERYIHRTVGELSGGQQQRVAIARALARRPRIIFADEPTGNLDEENTLNICRLLRQISKNSLVVMVTHEERIARFFADRIITLDDGRIREDAALDGRQTLSMAGSRTLYAGDFEEQVLNGEGLSLRVLRQADAMPVKLTLIAMKDRIVIKLEDSRGVSCGGSNEPPALQEGKRPELTLENLDQTGDAAGELFHSQPAEAARAGSGIRLPMMFREALRLNRGKGLRQVGMRAFLILLTILTLVSVSDFLTVAAVDPEDFITTDSHILEINIEQGGTVRPDGFLINSAGNYLDYLAENFTGYKVIPHVSTTATYVVETFRQLDNVSMKLGVVSYVPISALEETDLIYGRMPENSDEIVVDRWVLEAATASDGIIQNAIPDVSYFLGCKLTYSKKTYSPEIVGISDCGEPAVFLSDEGFISLGVSGVEIMGLSEFRRRNPGVCEDVVLADDQCIVITNNAGAAYADRIGGTYATSARRTYFIADAVQADTCARLVVNDNQIPLILGDMWNTRFYLYCQDKSAMKAALAATPFEDETAGYCTVKRIDTYSQKMAEYEKAASIRADARTIVTATILVLSMVMLYLLCRAQAQERLGMLSVYRLLGIPRRKLATIFTMESLLSSLQVTLPTALIVWAGVSLAKLVPDWGVSLLMPWQAVAGVFLGILIYHLLVSLLPLRKLLSMPPAQLAAKYDM